MRVPIVSTATTGTLLIVDDEAPVRRSLERLLRTEGYQIYSAPDAEAANRILAADAIDVIVCDQDMPGQKGTDFLRDAANKYPQQRRIMISGRFQSDDVAVAMDAGAIHKFMMKPWDDAILKADIRAAFRQLMTDLARRDPQSRDSELSVQDPAGAAEDRQLTRELFSAASDGSLALEYQPQVNLATGTVCGFEALLRWRASIGPIRPDRFIALAERSGSIGKLTHWVICEACFRAQRWRSQWQDARIGLNVSPIDLRDESVIAYLERTLDRTDLSPSAIQIEITESHAANARPETSRMLTRLADIGVSLAIDDFGAGATSLSYLADLPFSSLKLDRSLTKQLGTEKGQAVVQKILEMARSLEMSATIEGIETAQQAELARELGADVAQGYFFSKPLPRDSIEQWAASGAEGLPQ